MKIALAASFAANLFFVGLMGASFFKSDHKREGRGSAPNSFLQTLSDERKAEIETAFAKMRESRKASREGRREAWATVREAMTATPFDRDAMQVAMQAVTDARSERSQARNAQMLEFVSGMSDVERASFSKAMQERWQRRRDRSNRRSDD